MQRNSAVIIGASIVLGFLLFGLLIRTGPANWRGPTGGASGDGEVGRYQFLRANEVSLAVLDTKTGRVWRKFIDADSGPRQWAEDGPDVSPQVVQQQQVPVQQAAPPAAPKKQ